MTTNPSLVWCMERALRAAHVGTHRSRLPHCRSEEQVTKASHPPRDRDEGTAHALASCIDASDVEEAADGPSSWLLEAAPIEHASGSSTRNDASMPDVATSPSPASEEDEKVIVPVVARENAATIKSAAAHATET